MINNLKCGKKTVNNNYHQNTARRLYDTVIKGGYCIGCGSCASFFDSPFKMKLDKYGKIKAHLDPNEKEDFQKNVLSICPFSEKSIDENIIGRELYGDHCKLNNNIGYYIDTYAGYVKEPNYRKIGSSGGLVTWITVQLLKQKFIDKVIHVKPSEPKNNNNLIFEYQVSSSIDEIKNGAKSKYYPIELSKILTYLRKNKANYALVGLPCFIKAVRLLSRSDPIVKERLKFCIGLVCGHLKSKRFAEMYAWQVGIHPRDLISINFRKKNPGRGANQYDVEILGNIGNTSKRIIKESQSFYGDDWGLSFFKYRACDFCDDIFAETADIAIGDAWISKYIKDSNGTNIVIIRHAIFKNILEDGLESNALHLESLSQDEVSLSQAGSIRHRRDGLAYRLYKMDKRKQWRPTKRVSASKAHLNLSKRLKYYFRMRLVEKSHYVFSKALKGNKFSIFIKNMRLHIFLYETFNKGLTTKMRSIKLLVRIMKTLIRPFYLSYRKLNKITNEIFYKTKQ